LRSVSQRSVGWVDTEIFIERERWREGEGGEGGGGERERERWRDRKREREFLLMTADLLSH
jgi:hypothetical protein